MSQREGLYSGWVNELRLVFFSPPNSIYGSDILKLLHHDDLKCGPGKYVIILHALVREVLEVFNLLLENEFQTRSFDGLARRIAPVSAK